jgi:hypothetical protein
MRFPSLSQTYSEAQSAFLRFPLSLLCAMGGSILAMYLVDSKLSTPLFHLMLTLALGIPLFICLDTLAERKRFSRIQTWLSRGLGLAILAAIFLSFPAREYEEINRAPYIRYTVFSLTFHLVVAFIPYLRPGQISTFWTYNKNLFTRLVTGLFYSLVISVGVSLAVAAVVGLFGLDFYDAVYADILIFSFGVFNTWYFLAGIPQDFGEVTGADHYPRGLKIFTQFILVPLLLVYLAILYAYGAKIILTWDWPKGLVAYLISVISVLGIFTHLLLLPYQDGKENGWIHTFYKAFYYLLIPLIALLFLAIGIRVGEYGLTLNRYLVLLMGVWLTFISGYFILGWRNIKMVPISLAIILALASLGPWGMFAWSERSQLSRLEEILVDSGILLDGKIKNEVTWEKTGAGNLRPVNAINTNSLPRKELYQVNSILHYLATYHTWQGVYPWISEEGAAAIQQSDLYYLDQIRLIVETMGLEYVPYYSANYYIPEDSAPRFARFELAAGSVLEIASYDHMLEFVCYPDYSSGATSEILKGEGYSVSKPKTIDDNLVLTWKGEQITFETASLLKGLETKFGKGELKSLDSDELNLEKAIEGKTFRLIIRKFAYNMTSDENRWIEAYSGIILIKDPE